MQRQAAEQLAGDTASPDSPEDHKNQGSPYEIIIHLTARETMRLAFMFLFLF